MHHQAQVSTVLTCPHHSAQNLLELIYCFLSFEKKKAMKKEEKKNTMKKESVNHSLKNKKEGNHQEHIGKKKP